MDFGFAELVEKFEEYFGRRATKFLLGCVGFLVVATALNLAYKLVVSPLFNLFFAQHEKGELDWFALQLALSFLVVFVAIFIARYVADGYLKIDKYIARSRLQRWQQIRLVKRVEKQSEKIDTRQSKIDEQRSQILQDRHDIEEKLNATVALLETILKLSPEAKKMFGRELSKEEFKKFQDTIGTVKNSKDS